MTLPAADHVAADDRAGAGAGGADRGGSLSTTNSKSILPLPPWFWVVFAVGLGLRVYLAVFTEGTYDVSIWQQHAAGVQRQGLIAYYHTNHEMNHPPFVAEVVGELWSLSQRTGVPFRTLLRLPVVLFDAGILALLLWMLRANPKRSIVATIYWLNPLAIIFSAYHGNTDVVMTFWLLLCVCFLAQQQIIPAAIALGIALWLKLPGILVVPALVLFLPSWRRRLIFSAVAGVVAISAYVPALLLDAPVIYENVFAYKGQMIQTSGGIPVWGTRLFLPRFASLPPGMQQALSPVLWLHYNHNRAVSLGLILIWSYLRRRARNIRGLSLTISGVYAILYAFSNLWSFQYFAWSVPFWCLANIWFALAATLFAGGYIYGVYAFVCGNPWLWGKWDFAGHPFWPPWLVWLRDASTLFFVAISVALLAAAVYSELVRLIPRRIYYQGAPRAEADQAP